MSAVAVKHWREAATLMLVHCRNRIKLGESPVTNTLGCSDAARKQTTNLSRDDLEVLVLKRSSRSSFMPDLYVFPGGAADNADFSEKWLDVFGLSSPDAGEKYFGFARAKSNNHNATMFCRPREPQFSLVPSEIAFRINSIRETFEESGVLLARPTKPTDSAENPTWTYPFNTEPCAAYQWDKDTSKLAEWRQRVSADPRQFLDLCKDLSVVPDIWSLYDWSNWLTPPSVELKANWKRFDTAFYVCCLKGRPYVAEDARETVHHKWITPAEILQDYQDGRAELGAPQVYEMSRLHNFSTMHQLLQFVTHRVGQPMEQIMPISVQCADAKLFILPGDSLYPSKPDHLNSNQISVLGQTLEELTKTSPRRHRGIIVPASTATGKNPRTVFTLECNITLPYGHISPVADNAKPG